MWTLNENRSRVIKEAWDVKIFGCHMYILDNKLRFLKFRLKDWNNNIFGDVKTKVMVYEKNLKEIQNEINILVYNNCLQDKETRAQHDIEVALNMEEEF